MTPSNFKTLSNAFGIMLILVFNLSSDEKNATTSPSAEIDPLTYILPFICTLWVAAVAPGILPIPFAKPGPIITFP